MTNWSPDSESEVFVVEALGDCPLEDLGLNGGETGGLFGGSDSAAEVEGLAGGGLGGGLGTGLLLEELGVALVLGSD